MKKIIICLAFAMLTWHSFAQEIPVEITKSELFKDEYKNSSIVLVEDDGSGGVLIVRSYQGGIFSSGLGYYFEHYDSNLKLLKEYEYQTKQKKGDKKTFGYILGVIMNGQEVNMIEYRYDKEEKAYICNAMTSNINDFNFTTKELFRINSEQVQKGGFSLFGGGGASYDRDSGASMIINEDRTAFAVTVDIKDKSSETHKLYLFDKTLKQKIDHTFKRDIKDRKFVYENIDVSKDGNTLYLLGKTYTEETKGKKDGGRYQYELTRITKNDTKTQVFDTDDHYAASLKTIVFQDRLTCIGFYSDRNDSRFKGISYFELDPTTLSIKKSKFNPFTAQFIMDKYGKEDVKEKKKELKNLSFKKIIITSQNEIILNAEEFYITTHTTYSPQGGSHTYYVYNYDDIVSAKLNTAGEIVWARNINKRQNYGAPNPYFSYTSTAKGDDAYFFINAGEKVKKLSKDRISFGETSTKRSNLNVIRIKQNGDFDYKEILDDKENEVPFMVAYGKLSGDSVFILGQKGKKKQILKITL